MYVAFKKLKQEGGENIGVWGMIQIQSDRGRSRGIVPRVCTPPWLCPHELLVLSAPEPRRWALLSLVVPSVPLLLNSVGRRREEKHKQQQCSSSSVLPPQAPGCTQAEQSIQTLPQLASELRGHSICRAPVGAQADQAMVSELTVQVGYNQQAPCPIPGSVAAICYLFTMGCFYLLSEIWTSIQL